MKKLYTYVVKKIMKHPVIALTIILGPIVVALFIIFFIIGVLTSEEGGSNNGCSSSGDGAYAANFKIIGQKHEQQFLQWCASQHLDAAHTAGLAGNAIIEAGGWNGTGNYFGITTPGTQSGENGSTQNVKQYLDGTILHKKSAGVDGLADCPSGFYKYKKVNKSPYDLAGWWNTNILDTQDSQGPAKKGAMARAVYKQIAHGSSTVSDASDTANSSGSSCGSSDNSSDTDLISFAEKYVGIGYTSPEREVAQKISEGAPKSEVERGTDCDEFDWAVLKHCGYKVGTNFGNCDGEMSALKNYQVSKNDTHAGTIGVYPVPGILQHSFLLKEKYKGSSTKIVSEGPGKCMNTNIGWDLTGADYSQFKFYNVPKK